MIARSTKLLISVGVLIVDRLTAILLGLAKVNMSGSCVIINYHVVADDLKDRFSSQMRLLKKLTRPISAVRDRRFLVGQQCVAVTVDDAFCSFVRNAWPVLKELQIPVTLFVPTSYLGRRSTWVDYGGENPVGEEVISLQALCGLAADPLIDIGSHTATHADLVTLKDDEVRQELVASRKLLETVLNRRVDSISFPYGHFGARELRLAREAGYVYQFSVSPGRSRTVLSEGLSGRVSVQPSDWPIEFRLKILGAYRWLEMGSRWKHRMKSLIFDSKIRQRGASHE